MVSTMVLRETPPIQLVYLKRESEGQPTQPTQILVPTHIRFEGVRVDIYRTHRMGASTYYLIG